MHKFLMDTMFIIPRAITDKFELLAHSFQDLEHFLLIWIGLIYPDSTDVVNEFYASTVVNQFSSCGFHSVIFPG